MPFKSILRGLWARWRNRPVTDLADLVRGVAPAPTPFLDRLTSRSDWNRGLEAPFQRTIVTDGPGSEPVPAPDVAPWDREAARKRAEWRERMERAIQGPDKWPETDDPYAKQEPCEIVQDPGLERVRKLTERGLIVPIETKSDLSNVMDLIDRQEAAELHLRNLGMVWDKNRGWHLPDPYLA